MKVCDTTVVMVVLPLLCRTAMTPFDTSNKGLQYLECQRPTHPALQADCEVQYSGTVLWRRLKFYAHVAFFLFCIDIAIFTGRFDVDEISYYSQNRYRTTKDITYYVSV